MLYLIILGIVIFLFWNYGSDLRHRYFAWFMMVLTRKKDAKYEEIKKNLFKSLDNVVSNDPSLRKENRIKILEIGVGTGVNFEYYPNESHLVVVDMNPHFHKYYDENRAKFPNIKSEEIIVCKAEEMDMVSASSVDVVVMTLVLCSVENTEKILQQVYRVLAPGGRFYFIDHVREWDEEAHWFRQKMQELLTLTGVWPFLCDGCCLNRDILPKINKAGFSKVEGGHIYAPMKYILSLISPHLVGYAVK